MAVNLIGLPDETTCFAHTASIILLLLHVLVAIGLIIGAILIVRLTDTQPLRQLARAGSAAVGVAVIAGLLTMGAPGANWWSFLMAVGFIAAVLIYGRLWLLHTDIRHN